MRVFLPIVFVIIAQLGSAATASPVNISSVSVSSSVATVTTSSAHGIGANYGFCITGTSDTTYINICGTAVSVTSTTFTFNCGGCSNENLGAAGTAIAAREIICLSTFESGGSVTFTFLLWLTTPTGVANSALTSLWPAVTASQTLANTPTGGYLAAIQRGTTIEVVYPVTLGDTAFAKANAESMAQNQFLFLEDLLLGAAPGGSIQPGQYYGQFCDPVGCSF